MSAVKPFKSRLAIYLSIAISLVLLVLFLNLTGYDYSKSEGFFPSGDDGKGVIQAAKETIVEIFWPAMVLVGIVAVIELIIALFVRA